MDIRAQKILTKWMKYITTASILWLKKVQLAKDSETGVIMIWEITQDVDSNDDRSLLKAIYDEALSSASAAR